MPLRRPQAAMRRAALAGALLTASQWHSADAQGVVSGTTAKKDDYRASGGVVIGSGCSCPSLSYTDSLTLTLPTVSESETQTVSLPAATDTATYTTTLPTATPSYFASSTAALPTGTVTATETLTLPSSTISGTRTFTLPSSTATASASFTLPTETSTPTPTIEKPFTCPGKVDQCRCLSQAEIHAKLGIGVDEQPCWEHPRFGKICLPPQYGSYCARWDQKKTAGRMETDSGIIFSLGCQQGSDYDILQTELADHSNIPTFDFYCGGLPQLTATATTTMPTRSISETLTLSMPTSTETATQTFTLPRATDTATKTYTLPTASNTVTQSITLPTITSSITFTLPTSTDTTSQTITLASVTGTGTITLPSITQSETQTFTMPSATQTYTMPTLTVSRTMSLTLPSATQTFTLPTTSVSETITHTLPTATATYTLPSSTATSTLTFTLPTVTSTFTLPTSTATATATFTLPSATATSTLTFTLPTATTTVTLPTGTASATDTFTLASASMTATFSLPTASGTITGTMTLPTGTASATSTFTMPSASGTITTTQTLPTATVTLTLPSLTASSTQTFTLPTITSTYTLPTSTSTATSTITMPTATVTQTQTATMTTSATATITMPTASATITTTQTLPTATTTITLPTGTTSATDTFTLPTVSDTLSITLSLTLPTATTTATKTYSLPTVTESSTATFTLPTLTESSTNTFTLPSASETVSATLTLPSETRSDTLTLSLPSTSDTATTTFTLPSTSATTTFTLPTGSQTVTGTITLPTATASATTTFTLPTGSQTVTATITLPSLTLSTTNTFTLPTGTATSTVTLPTTTETSTQTATATTTLTLPTDALSVTSTVTLPTGTVSATDTFTLPTASDTATYTLTIPTGTMTSTITLPTGTTTSTETFSMPTATTTSTSTITLPTGSTTITGTVTLPTSTSTATTTFTLPTGTQTATITLPTGTTTSTLTVTLPTATSTSTATLTSTATTSITLPSQTSTATQTLTLPSETSTFTQSLTLPSITGSSTATFTLPTSSDTVTSTITLPSTSNSLTLTLPSGTGSATATFTLPTQSQTYTLPTMTRTMTATTTLPSQTVSLSLTLPSSTASATATFTLPTTSATYTLPTSTSTMTNTITLPSTTMTQTFTLPSLTSTSTATFTLPTATHTFTLPTSTATATSTFTLPSSSQSATFTLPSMTASMTSTLTLPTSTRTFTLPTSTVTATRTFTLPSATTTMTLPTGTVTSTRTITLPSATATPKLNTVTDTCWCFALTLDVTLSTTLPTLTVSTTNTFTLPSGTATGTTTFTIPSTTLSGTATLPTVSGSVTDTFTLPSGTATGTATFTLPSETSTSTATFTLPSLTASFTESFTLPTSTVTQSGTVTFPSVSRSLSLTITPPLTSSPTASPTTSPTKNPTGSPTVSPTKNPTVSPTVSPTGKPTKNPTTSPTTSPTKNPTTSPTISPTTTPPTKNPTVPPTTSPTVSPTKNPTVSPTPTATGNPTVSPTANPTTTPPTSSPAASAPSSSPTVPPTKNPTIPPTTSPTTSPTIPPTKNPTTSPTTFPTKSPTVSPSRSPTTSPPSVSPTRVPTLAVPLPSVSPTTGPPTVSPTKNPTTPPSRSPTGPATPTPTTSPTTSPPSTSPTTSPSKAPTLAVTSTPTKNPTTSPTVSPTKNPTVSPPTVSPTTSPPTTSPTRNPTTSPPTVSPVKNPTRSPTTSPPSVSPTRSPTTSPPSVSPTFNPTLLVAVPSVSPTKNPTTSPTVSPTTSPPSVSPTKSPTVSPTVSPTTSPTVSPTKNPIGPTVSPVTSPPSVSPTVSPTRNPTTSPPSSSPASSPPSVSPTRNPTTAATKTHTFTLPTATVSATVTGTPEITITLPSATRSVTSSVTLPSATVTPGFTATLPTEPETATPSVSVTSQVTLTLPTDTGTVTESISVAMPTNYDYCASQWCYVDECLCQDQPLSETMMFGGANGTVGKGLFYSYGICCEGLSQLECRRNHDCNWYPDYQRCGAQRYLVEKEYYHRDVTISQPLSSDADYRPEDHSAAMSIQMQYTRHKCDLQDWWVDYGQGYSNLRQDKCEAFVTCTWDTAKYGQGSPGCVAKADYYGLQEAFHAYCSTPAPKLCGDPPVCSEAVTGKSGCEAVINRITGCYEDVCRCEKDTDGGQEVRVRFGLFSTHDEYYQLVNTTGLATMREQAMLRALALDAVDYIHNDIPESEQNGAIVQICQVCMQDWQDGTGVIRGDTCKSEDWLKSYLQGDASSTGWATYQQEEMQALHRRADALSINYIHRLPFVNQGGFWYGGVWYEGEFECGRWQTQSICESKGDIATYGVVCTWDTVTGTCGYPKNHIGVGGKDFRDQLDEYALRQSGWGYATGSGLGSMQGIAVDVCIYNISSWGKQRLKAHLAEQNLYCTKYQCKIGHFVVNPSIVPGIVGTETSTASLPTGSGTVTFTIPTTTASPIPTESNSISLTATQTDSSTMTYTMPTATGTLTGTSTLPTASATITETATLTLPAITNYSMAMEPGSFYDGQEIRVQLKTMLQAPEGKVFHDFWNRTAMGQLQVHVFQWDPTLASSCPGYVAGTAPALYSTNVFGMTTAERLEDNVFVGAAHVTFPAPAHNRPFVLCFKHTLPAFTYINPTSDAVVGQWNLFSTENVAGGQYVFKAQQSMMWYNLPEATESQYAVIQLLSRESWNFTYAPSSCGSGTTDDLLLPCGLGDNLKIVPVGEACTLEHQNIAIPYMGSGYVQNDGRWDREAISGIRIGGTPGGVGRFGTQYANPIIDSWTDYGTYYPSNEESLQGQSGNVGQIASATRDYKHAYVYLRLPSERRAFDVCFSARQQRVAWRLSNSTLDSVPMWRKLYRCNGHMAVQGGTCAADNLAAPQRSFTVVPERVGWSMVDLTPNTWGTIVFDDQDSRLSNRPTINTTSAGLMTGVTLGQPQSVSNTPNYWSPTGGDMFRLVSYSYFSNPGSYDSNGLVLGSFPSTGCWYRGLDQSTSSTTAPSHGGFIDDGAEYPIGSRDLTGDPTIWNTTDDGDAQATTYSTVWVPQRFTRWYVCYRRTCGSGATTCTRNTGMRVLPWHDAATNALSYSALPAKFLHLEMAYTPRVGAGMGAVPLVPFMYGDDEFVYPPALAWYMDDTRSMTWGPIVIEKTNYSDAAKLDSRPWTGVRNWAATGCATAVIASTWNFRACTGVTDCDQLQCTQGSTLRLVRSDKPCDWPGFIGSTTQGANVTDGGAVECNSWDSTNNTDYCSGRRADSSSASTVAFYFTVPEVVAAPAGYRVCYRLQGWNWREVWPARESTEDTSPTNGGVDNWYQVTTDARSTVTLAAIEDRATMDALFIVSDTRSELSAAPRLPCAGGCENSGDIMRLVQMDRTCDVYPTQIDSNGWDPALADWHLSIICPTAGAGKLGQSGLYLNATTGHSPCLEARQTRALCKGMVCDASLSDTRTLMSDGTGDTVMLARMLKTVPDLYDDIVPYENVAWNHKALAANIQLPALGSTVASNRYKLCYKQMATANWIILNDIWEVQPAPGMTAHLATRHEGEQQSLTDLIKGVTLLGGEQQQFVIQFPTEIATRVNPFIRPVDISGFYAKLVKITGDLNHCLNPAGGTEAEPFGSATKFFVVGESRSEIRFMLTAPHEPGQYDLCVQVRMTANDTMSWWRGARENGNMQKITVVDNGVRYYVTPGNQPTNQGQTMLNFIRCTPPPPPVGHALPDDPMRPQPCDYSKNEEVFNTDPGKDRAKVIPANENCEYVQKGGNTSVKHPYRICNGTLLREITSSECAPLCQSGGKGALGSCDKVAGCSAPPSTFTTHQGKAYCEMDSADNCGPWNANQCTGDYEVYVQVPPSEAFNAAEHAGRSVFGASSDGVEDLGPADGMVDVAEMIVASPATSGDARMNYKVCVFTSFVNAAWPSERKAWVEVSQGANVPGQVTIKDVYTGRPAFQTEPAYASHWAMDTGLRPAMVNLDGESKDVVGSTSVALAGASTRYVQFPTGSDVTPSRVGFSINSYNTLTATERGYFGSDNQFKLVQVSRPKQRVPSPAQEGDWGKIEEWSEQEGASCFSPGMASANNIDACADPESSLDGGTSCPAIQAVETVGSGVKVPLLFQMPLSPGKYIVCYKLNTSGLMGPQPWLLVRSYDATDGNYGDSGKGAGFLYTMPSFLEFESAIPVTTGTVTTTNLTVHDLRTVVNDTDGVVQSLSGWCARTSASSPPEIRGEGVPCYTVNGATLTTTNKAYWQDLITIVNNSQVCPTPYDGPSGMGTAGTSGAQVWYPLVRTTNSSVMVDSGGFSAFSLPLSKPDPSGLQKICVFKSGEANYGPYASKYVTKKGVVYQVYNRGEANTGGGTGYWKDGDSDLGAPAQLLVTPMLEYNTTLRFIEYVVANAETQTLFGPTFVPPALVTDPMTGTLSRTPLLRSGSAVDFQVRVATASGDYIDSGTYAVYVHRCAAPTGWDTLACAPATAKAPDAAGQPFDLINIGGACSREDGPKYGWPSNGLVQFLTKGAVRFSLQYRSGCKGREFGCGIRFVARPTGTATDIMSLPQWINIEDQHYADAVQLGQADPETGRPRMRDVMPALTAPSAKCEEKNTCRACIPPKCFMATCVHKQPCSISIQARFEGPPELAPAGRVAVRYSQFDYSEITRAASSLSKPSSLSSILSGVDSLSPTTWPTGGGHTLTWARPEIRSAASTQYAYLNVSWSGITEQASAYYWTRLVVKVVRPEPTAVAPTHLRVIDLESSRIARQEREPTPRFWFKRDEKTPTLSAQEGNYIEALVPYELRYVAMAGKSEITTRTGLTNWRINAAFVGQTAKDNNRILTIIEGVSGEGPTEDNLLTYPQYTSSTFVGQTPIFDSNGWYLRFRVHNNKGCSRFTGGCSIKFTFTKTHVTQTPAMTVSSPVRVHATTLWVTTHEVLSGADASSAPAWDGLKVRAYPGTPCGPTCGFLYDEYHWGGVFGLINSPVPADGIRNRDDVWIYPSGERCAVAGPIVDKKPTCAVSMYLPSAVVVNQVTYWAATWTMRPNMPCYNCEFTFHSQNGAGPYTYGNTMYGIKTLTFSQDTLVLACNDAEAATLEVLWIFEELQSYSFSVRVEAAKTGDLESNALWPRWWTWIDTTNDVAGSGAYTLMSSGATEAGVVLRQQLAGGAKSGSATTTYSGLYFGPGTATDSPESPDVNTLTFHAMGPDYDSTVNGAVPRTMTSYSCTTEVTLRREDPTAAPETFIQKFVRITGVDRATAMCSTADGCKNWYTSVANMQTNQGGIVVNLLFTKKIAGSTAAATNDATPRNATVIAASSPSDTLAGNTNTLTFAIDTATQKSIAQLNSPIPSFYNPSGAAYTNTVDSALRTFTFGQIAVHFERTTPAKNSRVSMTIVYDDNAGAHTTGVDWPVRQAYIKYCGTVWQDGSETLESNNITSDVCTTMCLWVRPATVTKTALFWDWVTSATPTPGLAPDSDGAPRCGPSAATLMGFSLMSYYSVASSVAGSTDYRFIVYDSAISYTLTLGTQTLVPADDDLLTNASLTVVAEPDATDSLAERIGNSYSFGGLRAGFSFYGLEQMTSTAPARVSAIDLNNLQVAVGIASSPVEYAFKYDKETFASWEVLDEVKYDDECPSKRLLTVNKEEGYRTYDDDCMTPGDDWEYSDDAVAQMPFPIQTVVQVSGDGRGSKKDKRAWTFADDNENRAMQGKSLVTVKKFAWSQCNNGGVMTTHNLPASTPAEQMKFIPGLVSSWGAAADIYTNGGVATAWVMMQQPCQRCVLQLNLCYMGAATAATCLQNPSSTASDQAPLLADRTKLTKPFTVKASKPDRLQIFGQQTPAIGDDGLIFVGQAFSVDLEAVQKFSKWSIRSPTPVITNLFVDTEWECGSECKGGAEYARYGNGGFLQTPATDAELTLRLKAPSCEAVDADQLATATMFPMPRVRLTTVAASGSTVGFYFTRPCSGCKVYIYYSDFGDVDKWGKDNKLPLRKYYQKSPKYPVWWKADDVLTFRVMACATSWAWAGGAQVLGMSFRKQKAWSLTVWRVDRNNFPSWQGKQTATFQTEEEKMGNGNGLTTMLTSPNANQLRGGAVAVDGSATVRGVTMRACYRCKASMGGSGSRKMITVTSLTDATQIIAIPFPEPGRNQRRPIEARVSEANTTDPANIPNIKAMWAFEVYAADEYGERAYTASGPTLQPYQPRYSVHTFGAGKLDVATPSSADTLAGVAVSPSPSKTVAVPDASNNNLITAVTDGRPTAFAVTNGTVVYNGIPFGELNGEMTPPGVAVVQATGTGSYIPLSFSMSGAGSAPTRYFGTKKDIVLSFTVPATHLAVENAGEYGCKSLKEGASCSVSAYAVGHQPGSASTVYQLSTVYKGEATAIAECDNNASPTATPLCAITVDSSAKFDSGVAQFGVSLVSGNTDLDSCTCTVTISSTELMQSPQSVSITFTKRSAPTKFVWVGTSTFNTPAVNNEVHTVLNRTVDLKLMATNDLGETFSSVPWGTATFTTLATTSMDPVGCFVQQGAAVIGNSGTTIDITGSFQAASTTGFCTIQSSALGTLPLTLSDDLRATPVIPVKVKVVKAAAQPGEKRMRGDALEMLNFTGLTTRTMQGDPAAVTGKGATLTLVVVDKDDAPVLGDYHTTATLTGKGPDGEPFEMKATASMGEMSFMLDPMGRSTRVGPPRGAMPQQAGPAPNGPPVHRPILVNVSASATLTNSTVWTPESITNIGGLRFVRRPAHLWVEVMAGNMDEPKGILNLALRDKLEDAEDMVDDLIDQGMTDMDQWPMAAQKMAMLGKIFENTTDELQLVSGYPFDIMIGVIDMFGRPVREKEDIGGDAINVVFRPVAIPCVDADRSRRGNPWVKDTCVQGTNCKAMTWAALPDCGSNGWSIAASPDGTDPGKVVEEFELEGDELWQHVKDVRYTGPRDGPTRFQLSVAGSKGFETGYVFIGELIIQRMDRLCILNKEDSECTQCGPHPDPEKAAKVDLCAIPPAVAPLRRDERMSLSVAILDENDRIVRGDSASIIAVRSSCKETLTFAGVNGDFVTPPKFDVHKGVAEIEDVEFDGACGNMSLIFEALPGDVPDTLNQATKLRGVETEPFEVMPMPGDTPAPPSDLVAPPPISISFKLKSFPAQTPTAADNSISSFASAIDPAGFDGAFTKVVTGSVPVVDSTALSFVCGIPKAATGPIPEGCKSGTGGTGAFAGCSCSNKAANTQERMAQPLQTTGTVELGAKAETDVKIKSTSGSTFNDNPSAVGDLANQVGAAIKKDLTSGNSILKNQANAAFKDTDPNDLGVAASAKATPGPPEGPNTPKPTFSPTAGPSTSSPTRSPTTSTPTDAPTRFPTPNPVPPTMPPTFFGFSPVAVSAPGRSSGAFVMAAVVAGVSAFTWML
eukprot:TRINITY_DN1136_c0_g1_i15.p1 TRINITY_DN1136_c0_g1~~TRINITY_DN1136_c0_g1_i15.p1  ORF type:complete len:7355 (+),score=2052.37 TRINITY_DN1136_c0_g1_i15:242-22306(+)